MWHHNLNFGSFTTFSSLIFDHEIIGVMRDFLRQLNNFPSFDSGSGYEILDVVIGQQDSIAKSNSTVQKY